MELDFNVQADYLCHYTLELQRNWREIFVSPMDFHFQPGDFLAAWLDGGFDDTRGGTAAYIVVVYRGRQWHHLQMGGIFDSQTSQNDSLRMETIGMEILIHTTHDYLKVK